MRTARFLAAAGGMLALALLAGCTNSNAPDPDRSTWQRWLDTTAPTGSTGGGLSGWAGQADQPAKGSLDFAADPLTLDAIQLGCTGSGTMSFVVTLRAAGGASDSYSHDVVCADTMATPISRPEGFDTITRFEVAVTSDDGRGAWRVVLNPAD